MKQSCFCQGPLQWLCQTWLELWAMFCKLSLHILGYGLVLCKEIEYHTSHVNLMHCCWMWLRAMSISCAFGWKELVWLGHRCSWSQPLCHYGWWWHPGSTGCIYLLFLVAEIRIWEPKPINTENISDDSANSGAGSSFCLDLLCLKLMNYVRWNWKHASPFRRLSMGAEVLSAINIHMAKATCASFADLFPFTFFPKRGFATEVFLHILTISCHHLLHWRHWILLSLQIDHESSCLLVWSIWSRSWRFWKLLFSACSLGISPSISGIIGYQAGRPFCLDLLCLKLINYAHWNWKHTFIDSIVEC